MPSKNIQQLFLTNFSNEIFYQLPSWLFNPGDPTEFLKHTEHLNTNDLKV